MVAHDESGQLVEAVWFDYDAIDRVEKPPAVGVDAIARTARLFTNSVRWVIQDGMNNREGLIIRAKLHAWHLIPEVSDCYTLTELAGEGRKAKQSYGRWNDQFKRRFPELCNRHCKF